jgi:N-acetylglucosamine-6-phosphate deacetylase
MTTVVIHSITIVDDGSQKQHAWIAFDGETIAARGEGEGWRPLVGAQSRVIDGAGAILTPGFVDMHVHGGGGSSFTDGAQAIATGLAAHRRHGTTRSVVSLVSATLDDVRRQAVEVRSVMAVDPLVLGIHLEGPFLAASHKGAHDPGLLVAPSDDAVEAVLDSTADVLRQITIAPELPGGDAAIGRLVAGGVRVAIGHTAADYDGARAAFDAGASILTHAFNGMDGIHHRAPGPVAAAIDSPHVSIELVGDGIHVAEPVARILSASAGSRLALVTDAMAAADSGDGDYTLGGLAVRVRNGVARLVDGESIAGSTLTMDAALRFAVTQLRLDLAAAVATVTAAPARALGLESTIGRLAVGYPADAVLLDADLEVRRVWANGSELSIDRPYNS